jgi:hypothetical protein
VKPAFFTALHAAIRKMDGAGWKGTGGVFYGILGRAFRFCDLIRPLAGDNTGEKIIGKLIWRDS